MRRISALLFVLAALSAGVLAARVGAAVDDGTLSVNDGTGSIQIRAHGGIFGRITRGSVQLTDVNPGDGGLPRLTCDDEHDLSQTTLDPDDTVKVCTGTDIRFRLVGGAFRLLVSGTGINLSVVGKGKVTLAGKGIDPGLFSVNDADPLPLPADKLTFELNASATIS
jgi:hypothetical protein